MQLRVILGIDFPDEIGAVVYMLVFGEEAIVFCRDIAYIVGCQKVMVDHLV